MIGVHRSVINRELMGYSNLTLRRVAELAWALGWEIVFSLRKRDSSEISSGFQIPVSVGGYDRPVLKTNVIQSSKDNKKVAA